MSVIEGVLRQGVRGILPHGFRRVGSTLLVMAALAFWLSLDPSLSEVLLTTLSEAYIAVSVFVAATLALFYFLQKSLNIDVVAYLQKHQTAQIPIAALLGALPGCAGAIIVVTQYARGQLGFGSVMAVLIATMGDAAFLLLAQEPQTALLIFVVGFVVGTVSGYVVEKIHGPDFLRQPVSISPVCERPAMTKFERGIRYMWCLLFVPGLILGVLSAFQVDLDAVFGTSLFEATILWLGAVGAVLCICMWALGPKRCGIDLTSSTDKTIADTNFVTVWVVVAFLCFELTMHAFQLDLGVLFATLSPVIPLIAVLVGLIPGCGPHVAVTSLYLTGALPLSALIGNALSNDGDALFPAIALAPKACIVATIYGVVPALMVSYGFWAFY